MERSTMKKKKTRLIVRRGNENIALKVADIAFIYRDDTLVIAVDKDEKKYLCDKNLSALEEELDETIFFRANRRYLINITFVRSFRTYEKVKLEVYLNFPDCGHKIIVSQETAPLFRKWMYEE
ncbi:MAG TPA: LytTR family DNA-binding domain-containing protein [Flavisolibacter sp.]|nr:LytTR family DNA-binding domain-containing protein [Flavisolibacter sp.]